MQIQTNKRFSYYNILLNLFHNSLVGMFYFQWTKLHILLESLQKPSTQNMLIIGGLYFLHFYLFLLFTHMLNPSYEPI